MGVDDGAEVKGGRGRECHGGVEVEVVVVGAGGEGEGVEGIEGDVGDAVFVRGGGGALRFARV